MTLETLQGIQATLTEQYLAITSQHTSLLVKSGAEDRFLLFHANAILLRGALQLIAQLITQESSTSAAPPGAMGPDIP